MTYKVTDEGDTSTVFLDGEIDMDKTEGAKEGCRSIFCSVYKLIWNNYIKWPYLFL